MIDLLTVANVDADVGIDAGDEITILCHTIGRCDVSIIITDLMVMVSTIAIIVLLNLSILRGMDIVGM